MIACDISVNNVLAVVNSRLVGQYVRTDERLRTLGVGLKAWAQARGINDRSRGTISSFSLVLMLIHFLQRLASGLRQRSRLQILLRRRPYPGGAGVFAQR